MKNKINSLETLRGVAALVVALYHYPSKSFLFIENGNIAVYFFFTLSGFVIALNYFDKINFINDLLKFQIKRFYRLYPIHVFILFVVLAVQILKYFLLNSFNLSSGNEAFTPEKIYSLSEFFKHLLLIQAVYKDGYFLSWNSAAWTISTEFYTYFVFGLLAMITKNNKYFFIFVSILFIYFVDTISSFTNIFIHNLFIECIKYFLTGCIFYFIYERIKFRINDLSFIFILISLLYLEAKFIFLDKNILFCVIILLVSILNQSSQINKLLNFKPFVYFGTISYSFYMVHQSVLYLYIQTLKLVFKTPFEYSDGVATNTGHIYYDTLIMISYIFFSGVFASLMYKYIEIKFRK